VKIAGLARGLKRFGHIPQQEVPIFLRAKGLHKIKDNL
jgi:hypothetical protein